jgi:hypothetical protein
VEVDDQDAGGGQGLEVVGEGVLAVDGLDLWGLGEWGAFWKVARTSMIAGDGTEAGILRVRCDDGEMMEG